MVDTIRTQAQLLSFLHPDIGNAAPNATVLQAQAARDLIVSIGGNFPNPPDPDAAQALFLGVPQSGLGSRLNILVGSAAVPHVPSGATFIGDSPSVLLSKNIKPAAGTPTDAGSLFIQTHGFDNGTGIGIVFQPQINVMQIISQQDAPSDLMNLGSQIYMNDPRGGTGYGVYTNIQMAMSQAVTITNSAVTLAAAVVHWPSHQFLVGYSLRFGTTGTLPAPLTPGTLYGVTSIIDANNFTIAPAGVNTPMNTTTNGSGAHSAVANTGIAGLNPLIANTTGVNFIYDGFGSMIMANVMLQAIDDGAHPNVLAGIALAVGPGSNIRWDTGVAFYAATIATATIVDDTSSVTSLNIRGSHTYGADFSSGVFSGAAVRVGPTFLLSMSGTNPLITFDSTDYLFFNQSTDVFNFGVDNLDVIEFHAPPQIANQTGVYITEGVTPTARQVRWKDGAFIGAGDKVMVLV